MSYNYYNPEPQEEKTILYIHGFASSGNSGTVVMLRNVLYEKNIKVVAPDVSMQPKTAIEQLKTLVETLRPDLIIGTSMGAFYAEMLHGIPRILVNPSFHMSKTLVFKNMLGNQKFLNKREDGAETFKVDKQTVAEYKEVEKELFSDLSTEEKERVYGLFGINDKFVNYRDEFTKHYGKAHFILFEGEHQLNDKVLKKTVLPLVSKLLNI
jgi:predicted esterase YcpF (UPF0227 family)